MTRINCVPPRELHDKHLLAEYRELPRVFKQAHKAYAKGTKLSSLPQAYVLGTGHVRFFYCRLEFLRLRFDSLRKEMLRRGWKPQFSTAPSIPEMPSSWNQDWIPDDNALFINRQRIAQRLLARQLQLSFHVKRYQHDNLHL